MGPFAGGSSLVGTGKNRFSFLVNALPKNLRGTLFFANAGSVGPGTRTVSGADVIYTEAGYTGSFKEVFEGKSGTYGGVHLVSGVSDLLSGQFRNGVVTGVDTIHPLKGISGDFAATVTNFSSVFPLIGLGGSFDFDLALSNGSTYWSLDHGTLRTVTTTATGRFLAVPEPTTWALMLIGVGGIGTLARRRRAAAPVAA